MINTPLPEILLVDDKPENLLVLEKLLSGFPVTCIKAQSGNEALALMLVHDFMLVLLDVQMPNMDGYDVLEVMSWDEKTRYIPVIFITANYADEQHKLKGYQYGAVDYLYKPINDVILLSKIRVFLDLHEQKIQFKALNQRYELIVQAAGEGIIECNLEATILCVNRAAEKILGYPAGALKDQSLTHLFMLDTNETGFSIEKLIVFCREGKVLHKDDTLFKRQDGSLVPVEFTASPIHNAQNEYNGLVFVFSDITLRKTVQEQLTHLALYDHLTQLPNRLLFEKTISQSLARAKRHNKNMALMFLDLDHFKDINDRLGHDVGDLLLKGVASRLLHCVRETDTVARLGGDEFAIILDELVSNEDAGLIAEKIIFSLGPPFSLNNNEVFVSTSIGIAIYPISGETAVSLTKNADIAMYQAKQTGRDQYCFFTDSMNDDIHFRLDMMHSLRYAINRKELELYYQPKLSLTTYEITGTEALLRWRHPQLGLLNPVDFIEIAEEMGLIQKIGQWVIEEACRMNQYWHSLGFNTISVAINLSPFQIVQEDIIDIVKNALSSAELKSEYLDIELTETSLISNTEQTARVLNELHQLGVGITIDDFGTGYSSLYYLKKLPVDTLKIDQSFVRDITSDMNDAAIVKAVIALAHNLELNVIAEGVEQKEQLFFLQKNNCDQIQGFLFSTPLPNEEMTTFLQEYTPDKMRVLG